MSRLSRKEIKRDEVMETVGSAVDYARDHTRTIILAVVGLVLLVLATAGVLIYLSGRSDEATEALAEALAIQGAEVGVADPQPEDPDTPTFADEASRSERAKAAFESVRELYPRSDAADVAAAYLGQLAAAAGDLESARAHWEKFLDRQSEHALAAEVALNLMELDRVEGRSEELATRLAAMVDDPASGLPVPVVLHQLAVTYEHMGRMQDAADTYRRLIDEHPLTPYGAAARAEVEAIESELAG